jgi:signal transduction histidine kinase
MIRAMVKESEARVEVIAEPDLCAKIDPSLFEQIVINLCKNGLDSMENRPTSERKLIIHAHSFNDPYGAQWAKLDVIDRGHGVRDEDADRLFESFFTTKNNGLGIGLNLCRSIAESYQGHIVWVNNEAGGATFSIKLPKHSTLSNNANTTAI